MLLGTTIEIPLPSTTVCALLAIVLLSLGVAGFMQARRNRHYYMNAEAFHEIALLYAFETYKSFRALNQDELQIVMNSYYQLQKYNGLMLLNNQLLQWVGSKINAG